MRVDKFWNIPLPKDGMATIVANYDGPLYIVAAKSFYNINLIKTFSFPLPVEYYAAHFPLYPFLIRLFSPLFGSPYSMLLVTLTSSVLCLVFFYKLVCLYIGRHEALWMTFVFSIFPARWLIVRSVGSPEPLLVASIIASLYYFKKQNYLLAALWGVIAQLTKSVGVLLFISYLGISFTSLIKNFALNSSDRWFKNKNLGKLLPIFLIPVSLLLVFSLYKVQFGNFWAYFRSGDNIHLFFPPFQIFNYSQPWVGTFWLEEVIFVYLFGILGLIKLINNGFRELAWFTGVYFVSTLFVSHRDIIRYSLPIVPFLYLAFSEILMKKEFKIVVLFLIVPIYLFSLVYISQNVMPISDWASLL